ncbi:MAG TPA: (2Fe-2S)-binding protein [Spirochaetia bacterium]|nr:(2Fe-2S)-binding protein [Spirochaetia bacterium]
MREYRDIVRLGLNVNGERREVAVRPSDTLLRVLREGLGLVGTKAGCENGDCGACTVLIEGEPVKSCLMLAVELTGEQISTIEGLDDDSLQMSFAREAGFQCGFCTPGFLMNAHALLLRNPTPTDEELREWLSSNLCRCTGYEGIERSVREAVNAKSLTRRTALE